MFKYCRSAKIIYWGAVFDSVLELKYAISIHTEYEFLRSRISIYYDPSTNRPTERIRSNIRRYTPDFLIRHKQTGLAYWVEIKPRAFSDHEQLRTRRQIAENYIKWKQYDWQFRMVYDDEIRLNLEQLVQFNDACSLINRSQRKWGTDQRDHQFKISIPDFLTSGYSHKQTMFVMFGRSTP